MSYPVSRNDIYILVLINQRGALVNASARPFTLNYLSWANGMTLFFALTPLFRHHELAH
jgi:hypothetical protein